MNLTAVLIDFLLIGGFKISYFSLAGLQLTLFLWSQPGLTTKNVWTDVFRVFKENFAFEWAVEDFNDLHGETRADFLELFAFAEDLEVAEPDATVFGDGKVEDVVNEGFAFGEVLRCFEGLKKDELKDLFILGHKLPY